MIGITGTHLDRETEKHLKEINPGSVILFKRNISSAHQTAELISHIKDTPPLPSPHCHRSRGRTGHSLHLGHNRISRQYGPRRHRLNRPGL